MGKKIEHTFIDGVEGKVCTKCGEWKPLSEFGKDNRASDSLNCHCEPCCFHCNTKLSGGRQKKEA